MTSLTSRPVLAQRTVAAIAASRTPPALVKGPAGRSIETKVDRVMLHFSSLISTGREWFKKTLGGYTLADSMKRPEGGLA